MLMPSAKILIVEDNPTVAGLIEERVISLGHTVTGNFQQAEGAIESIDSDPPDLILMDIVLGEGTDGIELAKEIKKKREIPIIFLTGWTDEDTVDRVKEANPDGYIIKPFTESSLRIGIEIALARMEKDREAGS